MGRERDAAMSDACDLRWSCIRDDGDNISLPTSPSLHLSLSVFLFTSSAVPDSRDRQWPTQPPVIAHLAGGERVTLPGLDWWILSQHW